MSMLAPLTVRSSIKWLLLTLLFATATGCLSQTQSIPPAALRALRGGGLERAAILRNTDGDAVRLDPNSYVRLTHDHGRTPWLRGAVLRVSEDGIGVQEQEDKVRRERGVPWEMVKGVEIINPSGGKTAAMILITSAAVAAIATLISMDLMVSALTRGRGGGASFRIIGALIGACVSFAWGAMWADHQKVNEEGSGMGLGLIRVSPVPIRPLFSALPRRRAIVRGLVTQDAGSELQSFSGMNGGIAAGMRLWDMFEVSGGARYLFTEPLPKPPLDAETPQAEPRSVYSRSSFVGFARFDLHLDLDARRRVALRLGLEAGAGGAVQEYYRLNAGLRVRVSDTFFLGATFYNPTYVRFGDDSPLRPASGWTFPTGLEAGWAF